MPARLNEAEQMCQRALIGYEKLLGDYHMSTLDTQKPRYSISRAMQVREGRASVQASVSWEVKANCFCRFIFVGASGD
jgi:hypothetical protein